MTGGARPSEAGLAALASVGELGCKADEASACDPPAFEALLSSSWPPQAARHAQTKTPDTPSLNARPIDIGAMDTRRALRRVLSLDRGCPNMVCSPQVVGVTARRKKRRSQADDSIRRQPCRIRESNAQMAAATEPLADDVEDMTDRHANPCLLMQGKVSPTAWKTSNRVRPCGPRKRDRGRRVSPDKARGPRGRAIVRCDDRPRYAPPHRY
jgi:hypothetical protein